MDHPVFAMMHYNKGLYDSSPQCDTIHDNPDATHIPVLYMWKLLCISYLGAGVGWVVNCVIKVHCGEREIPDYSATYHACATPRRKSCCRLPRCNSQLQPIAMITLAGQITHKGGLMSTVGCVKSINYSHLGGLLWKINLQQCTSTTNIATLFT